MTNSTDDCIPTTFCVTKRYSICFGCLPLGLAAVITLQFCRRKLTVCSHHLSGGERSRHKHMGETKPTPAETTCSCQCVCIDTQLHEGVEWLQMVVEPCWNTETEVQLDDSLVPHSRCFVRQRVYFDCHCQQRYCGRCLCVCVCKHGLMWSRRHLILHELISKWAF